MDDPASTFSIETALNLHLLGAVGQPQKTGFGYSYTSSFLACLADARGATGRDVESGDVTDEPRTGHWLGAVGYMVLLDQIGTCFRPKGVTASPARESIIRCLAEWAPGIPPAEREALYALRCALAHDYSLINFSDDPSRRHRFGLDRRVDLGVVRLPTEQWSGEHHDGRRTATTMVSVRAFGDLADAIAVAVRAAAPSQLELILAGGPYELFHRYGILIEQPSDRNFQGRFTGARWLSGPPAGVFDD
jgi:hypothetical protein